MSIAIAEALIEAGHKDIETLMERGILLPAQS